MCTFSLSLNATTLCFFSCTMHRTPCSPSLSPTQFYATSSSSLSRTFVPSPLLSLFFSPHTAMHSLSIPLFFRRSTSLSFAFIFPERLTFLPFSHRTSPSSLLSHHTSFFLTWSFIPSHAISSSLFSVSHFFPFF